MRGALERWLVLDIDAKLGSREDDCKRLLSQIATALKERKRAAEELGREFNSLRDRLEERWEALGEAALHEIRAKLDEQYHEVERLRSDNPIHFACDWSDREVGHLAAQTETEVRSVTAGEYVDCRYLNAAGRTFSLPYSLPLIGRGKSILIEGGEEGIALLQNLVLKLAVLFGHRARFTLLDPYGQGRAFPIARELKARKLKVELCHREFRNLLLSIYDGTARIIEEYLDDESPSFEQLAPKVRSEEPFEFIFAAHFPAEYEEAEIDLLRKIARNGPVAGKYVIAHRSIRAGGMELERSIPNLETIELDTERSVESDSVFLLHFPDPPPLRVQREILARTVEVGGARKSLAFAQAGMIAEARWGRGTSTACLETVIGSTGREKPLPVWFGEHPDGGLCAHGMLAGMTGCGKSNLYHVLICGLAMRYPPEELELYLVDGKDGVEFGPYASLPHARVVSLNTPPELARSVLRELVSKKVERNELFQREGVSDVPSYRKKFGGETLPRILLLIDEYQELFEGDDEGTASWDLQVLARQGRSCGIHMLLGSQRFGSPGMRYADDIFGNTHLRLAMQMSEGESAYVGEFGTEGRQMVRECRSRGEIVVNTQCGNDGGNQFGHVSHLAKEDLRRIVRELGKRWRGRPDPVLFSGSKQPSWYSTPGWEGFFHEPPGRRRELVRQRTSGPAGSRDDPEGTVCRLGRECNVHGWLSLCLRRGHAENLLLVGEGSEGWEGLVQAVLLSLLCQDGRARVLHFGSSDDSAAQVLIAVHESLRRRSDLLCFGEENCLASVERLVKRSLAKSGAPRRAPCFVVLSGLARAPSLEWRGAYEPPDAVRLLQTMVTEGPRQDVHVVACLPSATMFRRLFGGDALEHFRHRATLQLSHDESIKLVGTSEAAILQQHGPKPIAALYRDMLEPAGVKFWPYAPPCPVDSRGDEQFGRPRLASDQALA